MIRCKRNESRFFAMASLSLLLDCYCLRLIKEIFSKDPRHYAWYFMTCARSKHFCRCDSCKLPLVRHHKLFDGDKRVQTNKRKDSSPVKCLPALQRHWVHEGALLLLIMREARLFVLEEYRQSSKNCIHTFCCHSS